jgi:hypothetical protein
MSPARRALLACSAAAAAAAIAGAGAAGAATASRATQTVLFVNTAALQLRLRPSTYSFRRVSPLATATSPAGANTARVYANSAWRLEVNGSGSFTDGGSPARFIPDSRMTISAGGGPPVALSAVPAEVASGAQTSRAGDPVALIYALTLRWTDPVSRRAFHDTLTYTAYTP